MIGKSPKSPSKPSLANDCQSFSPGPVAEGHARRIQRILQTLPLVFSLCWFSYLFIFVVLSTCHVRRRPMLEQRSAYTHVPAATVTAF